MTYAPTYHEDENGRFVSVPMKHGQTILLDETDFPWFSQYQWWVYREKHNWYACRRRHIDEAGSAKHLRLHREVLQLTDADQWVDHRDRNGLNCRRHNLRPCTHRQNNCNTRDRKKGNPYRGVVPRDNRWAAYVGRKTRIYLGCFATAEQAALAYDQRAREIFGEFAVLNFPEPQEQT